MLGVNDDTYDPDSHHIISNASCTTNCVAPIAKVLARHVHDRAGLHDDDPRLHGRPGLLDLPHKDLRRARAAAINLIPTSTGAARAIGLVLPELEGKVDGIVGARAGADGLGHRPGRSLGRETTADEVNEAFRAAASRARSSGILQYADDPLVSTDIVGSPVLVHLRQRADDGHGTMVKVFGWYDNEWGYRCRLVDLMGKLL